jgi:hypothetical protein
MKQMAKNREQRAKSKEHPSLILPLLRGGTVGLKKVSRQQNGKNVGIK